MSRNYAASQDRGNRDAGTVTHNWQVPIGDRAQLGDCWKPSSARYLMPKYTGLWPLPKNESTFYEGSGGLRAAAKSAGGRYPNELWGRS
jgi:hypothetical protein